MEPTATPSTLIRILGYLAGGIGTLALAWVGSGLIIGEKTQATGSWYCVQRCPTPTPHYSPTHTPTYSPSPTFKPSPTPTHTIKPTFSPSPTMKLRPSPTFTPTPKPSLTPTPKPSPTPKPTFTSTPTRTPTPSPTPSYSPSPTKHPSPSPTYLSPRPSPTTSYTPSPTPTAVPPPAPSYPPPGGSSAVGVGIGGSADNVVTSNNTNTQANPYAPSVTNHNINNNYNTVEVPLPERATETVIHREVAAMPTYNPVPYSKPQAEGVDTTARSRMSTGYYTLPSTGPAQGLLATLFGMGTSISGYYLASYLRLRRAAREINIS